jgi:hypothetical protein
MHLVQQNQSEKLAKMRRKLAASQEPAPAKVQVPRRRRRGKAIWPWAMVAISLVTVNILLLSKKDKVLEKLGFTVLHKPAGPQGGISRDEQARFWAYAAYDQEKLRGKFTIGPDAVIDPVNASHHLERLLAAGVSENLRAEILALKSAPRTAGKR